MVVAVASAPSLPDRLRPRPATSEEVAAVAKALAHPARVAIVRLLLDKPACVGCDIVEVIGLAQSTVSEHLRILRAAGVISGEIERPHICYCLNPDGLRPLAALLDAVFAKESAGDLSRSLCCPPSAEPDRDTCDPTGEC